MDITMKLADNVPGIGRVGETVTLALTPSDVHDPTEIPTYLAGYGEQQMRADEASPPILVTKDSDKYRTFDEDDTFRRVQVKASIQKAVPEIDPGSSLTSYTVEDRFVGSFIPDVTEANADAYRPRMAAAKRCWRAIMMDREIDVWTLLTTSGSWDSSVVNTLTATTKWSDASTRAPGTSSNPIEDLQLAAETSLAPITDVWMNQRVAHAFLSHPNVKEHFKQYLGNDGAIAGLAREAAQAMTRRIDFEVPGIGGMMFHVAPAKYREDGSSAPSFILGNDVVMIHRPAGVPTDGEDIATTYTFRRKGPAGVGFSSREFRVEGRGPTGGTMVVVSEASVAKMTGTKVGGLIKNAVL